MKFKCLGTGSTGNCYLVEMQGGGSIILDAGIDIKKITKEINLNSVDFAFISHCHNDHAKAKKSLQERGVRIIEPTDKKISISSVEAKNGANLKVVMVPVEHGDCINSAIIIQNTQETILYVTDFTCCKYDLSKFSFTSVIVECNYIEENVVGTPRENTARVLENISRHQSLKGCDLFLSKLNLKKCKEIILIHFSENYSDPINMGIYINNKYKIKTLCCKKYGGYDTYE